MKSKLDLELLEEYDRSEPSCDDAEEPRLFRFDNILRTKYNTFALAGFDEAGRGCLAGPVFIAGVILKPDFKGVGIDDSKKLTHKQREELFDIIIENAIDYKIVSIDPDTIDRINILEATRSGFQQCYDYLDSNNNLKEAITDYMNIKTSSECNLLSIPKADATSLSVASASILAKVARDRYMDELDKLYPDYNFKKNKGYGTKDHLEALEKFGVIDKVHRKSYKPVADLLFKQGTLFD